MVYWRNNSGITGIWGWFGNLGKLKHFDGLLKKCWWDHQDLGLVWKSQNIGAFGLYTEEISGLGADLKNLENRSTWMVWLKNCQCFRLIWKSWNTAAVGFYTEGISRFGAAWRNLGKLQHLGDLLEKYQMEWGSLGILGNCSAWIFLFEEIPGFEVGWKSPGGGSGRGQDAFSSCWQQLQIHYPMEQSCSQGWWKGSKTLRAVGERMDLCFKSVSLVPGEQNSLLQPHFMSGNPDVSWEEMPQKKTKNHGMANSKGLDTWLEYTEN